MTLPTLLAKPPPMPTQERKLCLAPSGNGVVNPSSEPWKFASDDWLSSGNEPILNGEDMSQPIGPPFMAAINENGRAFLDHLRAKSRDTVIHHLERNATPEGVTRLGHAVLDLFDLVRQGMDDVTPCSRKEACHADCSSCCHLLLFVDALEIFLVTDYLEHHLSIPEMDALKSRLEAFASGNFGLYRTPRPACPLLVGERCIAYEVRPMVCRAQNAFDELQCREKLQGKRLMVEGDETPVAAWQAISGGLSAGLTDHGLSHCQWLEFASALLVALKTPNARVRWLAGEPVFNDCPTRDSLFARAMDTE